MRTSLKALGLRVQLGHPVGEICNLPVPAFNNDFVVLDDHGLHDVAVDFCGCTKIKDHTVQLLRCGWYPATVGVPKTAATFRLLERFHLLTCESKASAFEFYHSLARETDNVSTYNVKVCILNSLFFSPALMDVVGSVYVIPKNGSPMATPQNAQARRPWT